MQGRGRPRKASDATTLFDLGITRQQSSRWQQLASIPESDFEQHLAEMKANGRISTRDLRRRAGLREKVASADVFRCGACGCLNRVGDS